MENRIVLHDGESFVTRNENDAIVLLGGAVFVSPVPFREEEPGRAVRIYEAHTGDSVPSLFYTGTDGTLWRFSLTAVGETELFSFADGAQPSMQDTFIKKAGGTMTKDRTFPEAVLALYETKKAGEDAPPESRQKKEPAPEYRPDCRTFPDTKISKKDFIRFCLQGIPRRNMLSFLFFVLVGIAFLCSSAVAAFLYIGNTAVKAGIAVGCVLFACLFFLLAKKTAAGQIKEKVGDDIRKAVIVRLFSMPAAFFRSAAQPDFVLRLKKAGENIKDSFEGLTCLWNTEPEREAKKENTLSLTDGITVDSLSFSYDGQRNVFENLSLQVHSGEFLGITGTSGCGKSTLLRLLAGLETPQSGTIRYGDMELQTGNSHRLRRQTGFVTQEPVFIPGSVYDNISLFAPGADERKIKEAAQTVGLAACLQTMLSEDGSPLSDGQKQRLALVRVLLRDGDILFLDDALYLLSPSAQANLLHILQKQTATRILCTQQTQLLRGCDRILVLQNGHIAEEGTYKDLLHANGAFAAMTE